MTRRSGGRRTRAAGKRSRARASTGRWSPARERARGTAGAPARTASTRRRSAGPRTLAIDVGGSGLKAAVLDGRGRLVTKRIRVDTPVGATPEDLLETLVELVEPLRPFDRISIGFPGAVREGSVLTAPNLGNAGWGGFPLADAIAVRLECPARLVNDADMQGLAVIRGHGVEVVITLGTGFGTAVFQSGRLAPHLELGQHRFRKRQTYDQQLGDGTRRAIGDERWNRRVRRAIRNLRSLINFDHLFIGGGNAKRVRLELPGDVTIVSNKAGVAGGIALWRDA